MHAQPVVGSTVQSPGEPCGSGLTKQAAQDLGLKEGTPVGTSLVDAHAGGLGVCFPLIKIFTDV